jgi:hypothetical protein
MEEDDDDDDDDVFKNISVASTKLCDSMMQCVYEIFTSFQCRNIAAFPC